MRLTCPPSLDQHASEFWSTELSVTVPRILKAFTLLMMSFGPCCRIIRSTGRSRRGGDSGSIASRSNARCHLVQRRTMEAPDRRMCAATIECGPKRCRRWQVLHSQFAAARSAEGLGKHACCTSLLIVKEPGHSEILDMGMLIFWPIGLHRFRTLSTSSVCPLLFRESINS